MVRAEFGFRIKKRRPPGRLNHLGSVRMVVNENGTIEPSHTFGVVGYVKEFDSYFNEVVSCPVFGKNNTDLEEKITIVEQ